MRGEGRGEGRGRKGSLREGLYQPDNTPTGKYCTLLPTTTSCMELPTLLYAGMGQLHRVRSIYLQTCRALSIMMRCGWLKMTSAYTVLAHLSECLSVGAFRTCGVMGHTHVSCVWWCMVQEKYV